MDCSTIAKIIIKIAEGIRIGPINQFIINKGEIDYDLVIEELNQSGYYFPRFINRTKIIFFKRY